MRIEYTAGLFDGEGSIGLYRFRGDKFYLRTQLTQNKSSESTWLMRDLQKRFGGSYTEQRSLSGRIKYNWQLGGSRAAAFLCKICGQRVSDADSCAVQEDENATPGK